MNKKLLLCIVVMVLGNLICTFSYAAVQNHKSAAAKDNQSSYTEDKLNIAISPKQPEFTLRLKSNPTTGFSWFLREYDTNLITPIKHSFEKPTKTLMGAPGYELWTFKVKPAGFVMPQQTAIRLTYARPWESSDSATQIVYYIFTRE